MTKSASTVVAVGKKDASARAATKKAREAEMAADDVFAARLKYEQLLARVNGLTEYASGGLTLVTAPGAAEDEEGVFEPEELDLVPTDHLWRGYLVLEEAQEVLTTMMEQVQEVLDARPD